MINGRAQVKRRPAATQSRAFQRGSTSAQATGWNYLLSNTRSVGVHADDRAQAQNLTLPEWSHLNRTCATVFTDAYVRRLAELTARLQLRPTAPRPLDRLDCVAPEVAF